MNIKRIISVVLLSAAFLFQCVSYGSESTESSVVFIEDNIVTNSIHKGQFSARASVYGKAGQLINFITALYNGEVLCKISWERITPETDKLVYNSKEIYVDESFTNAYASAFVLDNSLRPLAHNKAYADYDSQGNLKLNELRTALKRFDEICSEDTLDWLASLYDPEIGGFYYSRSARDYEGFLPDLESTHQAFTIMRESGIIPGGTLPDSAFPPEIRDKIGSWVQNLQSDEDGYFYHPQWGSDISVSRRERDLMWATAILERCGFSALYALPSERLGDSASLSLMSAGATLLSVPDYYTDESKFEEYLNSLSFSTGEAAYASANELTSSIRTISSAGFYQKTVDFLIDKQDKNTGLWGGALDRNCVNAAMKASSFFTKANPYPNFDKMVESVIYVVKNEAPKSASALWNPAVLLTNAKASLNDAADKQPSLDKINSFLPEFINGICDNAVLFKKSDGGFSYYKDKSIGTSQSAEVSLGLTEGDINSTLLCTERIRNSCYSLAGISDVDYYEQYRESFLEKLKSATAPQKISKNATSFSENFENMTYGKTANDWTLSKSSKNSALICAFPETESASLCLTANGSGNLKAVRPLFLSDDYDTLTYEFDIRLTKGDSSYERWSVYLGNYAAEFIIDGKNKTGFTVNWRTGNSGTGVQVSSLQANTAYHIKIEYSPGNTNGRRVVLYVNDREKFATDEYYGFSGSEAALKISEISFYGWSDTCGGMFVDNIEINLQ